MPRLAKKEAIAMLRELLASGAVTPVIDSTFHVGAVREAFRHMVAGDTRGKVIIATTEVGANEAGP